ncbi:MAG TPA: hypothetical protein VGG64_25435 [Pirellulales bacterium]|jgi:hypothetical protein
MSQAITNRRGFSERIARECRRMRTAWTNQERNRRQAIARRRQELLQPLLVDSPRNQEAAELWAVGSVSAVDLARLAG